MNEEELFEKAKKELQSYNYCSQRITKAELEILQLQAQAEKITTVISKMPKAKNSQKTKENTWAELIDLKEELKNLLIEDQIKKVNIVKKIKKVIDQDEELGTILQLKYLGRNITNAELAKRQGYQKRYFLKKVKKAIEMYSKIDNVGGANE